MALDYLFVDTSAFYALIDKRDKNHESISNTLTNFNGQLFTSNYVIDELITLLKVRKISMNQYTTFIDLLWQEKICTVLRITENIDKQSWSMHQKYFDQDFSFTDCSSFVLMRIYKIKKACSLDSHFKIAGFEILI